MDRHQRRTHLHHRRVKRDAQVVTKIHYLTLKPTFSGPVAGYSTVLHTQDKPPTVKTTSPSPKPQSTKAPQKTTKANSETPSPTKKPTSSPKSSTETSSALTEKETSTVDVQTASSSRPLKETISETISETFLETISVSRTVGSALGSSTPTSIANNDGSGSSGALLGGIISGCAAAVVVLLLIAAIFYRRRKQRTMNQAYGKTEDEKTAELTGGAAGMGVVSGAASINEKASRVSLKPVTQFNPMLNPPAASPVVKTGPASGTGGHGIPRKPIPAPLALSKPPQSDLRPSNSDNVSIPAAPVMPAAQPSPTLSAFSDGFVPGTPVAGPVDAAALAAAGKTAPVYRVQMEYTPTQADELELHAGGLVRMLHEYDDGWALCVRMDRSAQGVCPRTCLSARPVKPRPNPASGSPASRQRRSPPSANGRSPQGPVQENRQVFQSPANSQQYVPYSDSRPGTPSQQQRPQTPKAPQTTQPLPQITVTPTESEFSETKPEIQVNLALEASANANASAFHAM
ncbi:hypothetical protein EV426DRAFT_575799 [Tirmania nivea]|nr:hypothetical protein EV426DRAFT_575799 [Tirmania nivea]